ncbi:MAG: class II fructose-1,6-bisphosphate aldolase [Clostridiales bacterium]|nr:class II fructose-1,6-bisphosphate aldolase [Clostridiales bacterium]
MALVNPLSFIQKAREKGVAIAAFNVHNLETIQAVAEGAAEERAPVIIQTTPGTLKHAGVEYIAACVKVASEKHDIPIALHVDHCPSYNTIVQCIRNGYTSVMIDGSMLPYEENVALVKKVVELAHSVGIAVEAELGRIGGTEDDITLDEREATFTVPEEARDFVEATGVDTLAVAIGTAHGVYKWEPKLDFKRLAEIRELVDVPLVLHGASGVDDESIKKAITGGICKINIATELKIPMAEAIQEVFRAKPDENDPRKYMGPAKEAVKEVVRKKIRLCGCNGLADELEGLR